MSREERCAVGSGVDIEYYPARARGSDGVTVGQFVQLEQCESLNACRTMVTQVSSGLVQPQMSRAMGSTGLTRENCGRQRPNNTVNQPSVRESCGQM